MKRVILFLLCVPVFAFGQRNVASYTQTNNAVSILGRTFTGSTSDTTQSFDIAQYKTIYLSVSSPETCTVLIDYALSLDGSRFSAFAVLDSLVSKPSGATVDVFKGVDFTSTTLGALYVRFRLRTSALAFALGTSTPTYTVMHTFKRY